MSLCINPQCPQPNHPDNSHSRRCAGCGSDLMLQGRLRVMRLLSSHSGFGKVYEAYDRNIAKILKVLKESHNSNSKVLELFRREASVLSQLNHPGVPRVDPNGYFAYYPHGSAEPLHCIEMEKIDGPNLRQWMVQQGNHPISHQQALLWLTQLVDVLHLVHEHNYFHRDIKPENIMLRSMGQLVLVDFGAAREMTDTYMAHLGASGITTISSAGYTPPEQEQGQAVPQSDFYALGRTLVYLVTAKAPNDPEIYDSRSNSFNWRPLAPQIEPALAELIDSMIAPRAIDRPQTTAELLQRLMALRQQPAIAPPTAKPWPRTTLGGATPDTLVQTDAKAAVPARQHRPWWLGIAGAAGALVLGGGAWWLLQRPPSETLQMQVPTQQVSQLKTLQGHRGSVQALQLLADGETLLSGSADGTVRIWNLRTGAQVDLLEGHQGFVNALAVTPDQQRLFSAGADGLIHRWNLTTGEPLAPIADAHETVINSIDVSPDGRRLASASSDGLVKVWDAATGELLQVLEGHQSSVNEVLFTRDSNRLASAGQSLRLWDLNTWESKVFYETKESFINGIAISPDNQLLLSVGADKLIRLWNMTSGELMASITGHDSYINDVVISRDGQSFVTAGADKTVRSWDMDTQQGELVLTGFDSDIYRFLMRFSQGQIYTVGGEDNAIKIWLQPNSPAS